jgi:V8-like Glu-specific endopeptidase
MSMKQILTLALMMSQAVVADEGMWTVDNFPVEKVRAAYGVEISNDWLNKVTSATVRIEGGCTGSFVSPNGLVLTNRHCIWDCLSENSSEKNNIWKNGFVAQQPGAEKTCKSEQISVLIGITDISNKINDATSGLSDAKANKARKRTLTRLEKSCEKDADELLSCESVSLYNGGRYAMYRYKRYSDVRLVFAPEEAIAAFGGDPDNFNFPRWTLDMSLLRVYEDGQPAHTKNFFKWDPAGAAAGEVVFVTGHPGSTDRSLTVAELKFQRDITLPDWLMRYSELRGRYIQFSKIDDEAFRIVQNRLSLTENGIKVRRNELATLLDDTLIEEKSRQEQSLRRAIIADPKLAPKYGSSWDEIETAQHVYLKFRDHYLYNEAAVGFNSDLFGYARTLVRAAAERAKDDEDRRRGYTDSALPQLEQRLLAPAPVYPSLEKLRLSYSLEKMRESLGVDDPFIHKVLGIESPDSLASKLIDGTQLADPDFRKTLWDGGEEALDDSKDPMIRMARIVERDARALGERYEDEVEAPINAASEKIAHARFLLFGTDNYPDATFTFRVSYGAVESWIENGTEVDPFTTIGPIFDRATGQWPFALPESWIRAKRKLESNTRFNFISTVDITGGNSGSPVVDKDGMLVGLAFDGNVHSIAGSYWFDSDKNRAIAVHPAVMLEVLEKVYGANHLVAELTGASDQ